MKQNFEEKKKKRSAVEVGGDEFEFAAKKTTLFCQHRCRDLLCDDEFEFATKKTTLCYQHRPGNLSCDKGYVSMVSVQGIAMMLVPMAVVDDVPELLLSAE
ncbi:hypothetical protein A2U01_0027609 [Trifolium medium]|uniref:Uncharacterized protein n=1 Tax=Trifolium medium TaxID=97028 RepID=A0A392P533_9FABA|nr:hypothetical protein [Trifolium medium]